MIVKSTNKKAVHFGAGRIGRGFVACFLHNSGYEVVFAGVTHSSVDNLNAQKSYRVIEVGAEGTTESIITNYLAINSKTHEPELVEEIATADVLTCSVGLNVLKFIAPVIAKGIDARSEELKPLAVIACENAVGATDTLAEFIKDPKSTPDHRLADHDKRARYANSAIDRIVPAQGPNADLDVTLEKFYEWIVERTPFEDRKLYTVNTGHATAGYHGYNRKKRTVYDALQDRYIRNEAEKALQNTAQLITEKHGIPVAEQQAYVKNVMRHAVERVGRAPLRKLSRKERFIGPGTELAERNEDCSALLGAAEMAFRFQNVDEDEESKELAEIMVEHEPEDIVSKVCGLQKNEKLYPMVVDIVKRVQADNAENDD
ncbi:hypothetical protein GE09DRAFT_1240940 [Coniochaeta sp. 2T2.1]|nr:hypothetical protein GE09DRAFT_1240940 [Coniochaeta sp. 2T2.1]